MNFISRSLVVLFTLGSVSFAADWPQWRGAASDGISAETGWQLPSESNLAWKRSVGPGCASFAVVGERVYTLGNGLKGSDAQDVGSIYCLDVKTGETIWKHDFPSVLDPKMFDGGQDGSPTIDADRLYALGRQGQVFCLNRETGKVLWQKDLVKDFGGRLPNWSYSGSPLVLGKMVILEGGGDGASAIALDKLSGETIWKTGNEEAGYASPYPFTHDGQQLVAFFNGFGLVVRHAADGKEYLRFPWKTNHNINAATPLVADGKIFIAAAYDHGAALLPLKEGTPEPIWQSKVMRNKMATSVLWNGDLYGFDEGTLACVEFATGNVKWQQKGMGLGSLMLADGKLIILSDKGELVIAEAAPGAYKELAKVSAVPGTTWVTPVLANGRIYTRNNVGDIACYNVGK